MVIAKYRLKKDLPMLKAGVIFEHRKWDKEYPDWGNPGCGVMILGWLDGDCQGDWAGETYIFPGQLAGDKEWFEPLNETQVDVLSEIKDLKRRLEKLENLR